MSVRDLPLHARYRLAELLDRPDAADRDWNALASSLGLQDRVLPTDRSDSSEDPESLAQLSRLDGLLEAWAAETSAATVRNLHAEFVKLGRVDAVETLLSLALLFRYE